jgi:hypothetical protein
MMTQVTLTQMADTQTPTITVEMVTDAITHLNRNQLRDVWQFVQFLDYKATLEDDGAEDEALWVAVQAHEAYKAQHPEESPEIYHTKEELSRAEVLQRLHSAGLIREPGVWDTAGARTWRELPQEEKEHHLRETQALYLPDAAASRAVIRGRKRLDTDLPRTEVERRLHQAKLIRPKRVWDTAETRRWDALADDEKERFITEMNELYFPDAPASRYITESRE